MNKIKKLIALIICLLMAMGSFAFAEEVQLISAPSKDYEGHWAETTIQKWLNDGKVTGYPDGSYKPDNNVTRAEFVKMVNGIINYNGQGKVTYSDVSSTEWFYDYISVAQEIGYISGYSDTKFGPNDYITREQAASILSRIQYLNNNATAANKFSDNNNISSWAKEAVGAASHAGFITGYNDESFRPKNNLTRAEALTMLDNVLVNAKNVVIYNDGDELKDTTVNGDLVIAKTVGDGDVQLSNLNVNGELKVYGGGANSIYFNNVKVSKIAVEKDKVRLVLDNGTTIEEITVSNETILENKNGKIAKVTVAGNGEVTLSGNFEEVVIEGNGDITLDDAVITKLIVNSLSTIQGKGAITALEANVDGIEYEAKVEIKKVTLGEGVTKQPAAKKEEVATGGGGGDGSEGPDEPTPDPDLNKDYKFILKLIVSRVDSEDEIVPIREAEYHSFNEYKGSVKLSSVIGEEINYIIDKLEADDSLFVDKATPYLKKINTIIADTQSADLEDSTSFYNTDNGINWGAINNYFADTSIVLPDELKENDGNFTIDDIIIALKLYNSSDIESDLAKISENFPERELFTIKTNSWSTVRIPMDTRLLDQIIEDIFSNDQVYKLSERYFWHREEINDIKYEFKLVFDAEKLD